MIENSKNVDSNVYRAQIHDHKVTQCIHERAVAGEEGAQGAQGAQEQLQQKVQKKEPFSLKGLMMNGVKSLASRAMDFWNDAGNTAVGKEQPGRKVTQQGTAADTLATAVIKSENGKNAEITVDEEKNRKVGNVEGAVSGGLDREQGGIKKFLQKFGETIAKGRGRIFKQKSVDEKELSANNTDFSVEDNSYLLDSYSKTGQYSTLAKDRSLEGNFKAKG